MKKPKKSRRTFIKQSALVAGSLITLPLVSEAMAAPSISSFTPTGGPDGTTITISGSGFNAPSLVVNMGSSQPPYTRTATIISFTDTQIIATVPNWVKKNSVGAQADATSQISVINDNGAATSTGVYVYPYCTVDQATYSEISPIGSLVTVYGTNLQYGPVVKIRYMNSYNPIGPEQFPTIYSSAPDGSWCKFVVPEIPDSLISILNVLQRLQLWVQVRNQYVDSSNYQVFGTFIYPNPIITSFTPTSGSNGDILTLSGTNLQSIGSIQFGDGGYIPLSSVSQYGNQAALPIAGTTGTIKSYRQGSGLVQTVGGSFTFLPPAISSWSPQSGDVGTVVELLGTNLCFGDNVTTTVKFHGTVATPTTKWFNRIVVPAPAGGSTGYIEISNGYGTTHTSTVFQYPRKATPLIVASLGATISNVQYQKNGGSWQIFRASGVAFVPTDMIAYRMTVTRVNPWTPTTGNINVYALSQSVNLTSGANSFVLTLPAFSASAAYEVRFDAAYANL